MDYGKDEKKSCIIIYILVSKYSGRGRKTNVNKINLTVEKLNISIL